MNAGVASEDEFVARTVLRELSRIDRGVPTPFGTDREPTAAGVERRRSPTGVPFWMATDSGTCKSVLGQAAVSRSAACAPSAPSLLANPTISPRSIMSVDGAQHAKLKRAAMKRLGKHAAVTRCANILERTRTLLNGMPDAATVDLVPAFTAKLPLLNLVDLLGLPESSIAEFGGAGEVFFDFDSLSPEQAAQRVARLLHFCLRTFGDPEQASDGAIADFQRDPALSRKEAVELTLAFLTAGYHTVAGQLSLVLYAALASPVIGDLMRQSAAPEPLVKILVHAMPVTTVSFPRRMTAPLMVDGNDFRSGDMVVAGLGEAGERDLSDEEVPVAAHENGLAFGYGRHRCPGEQFSIEQITTAAMQFLHRYPRAALSKTDDAIVWQAGLTTRGISKMIVELDAS
ncbi:hypothetical protein [Nocardia sp. NPDC050793]|uniref:hypothetical protein n=1 Tax=Nocardia sp. NPDC050793 TaxID=3155159 RepID=UPI0033E008E8